MPPSRTGRASVAAALIVALSGPAAAQEADDPQEGSGSDSNADDRVAAEAEGDPGGFTTGNDRLKLTISGQVNRAVLLYDDGEDTGIAHVDNDNSSTRIRFVTESEAFSALTFGAVMEVEFQSNPSNLVSQVDEEDVGDDTFDERKFEVYAKSDAFGQLLIGQGSTASDGTAEVDLSGTGVAGYSSVEDTGGGLRFTSGGTLTPVNVRSVFTTLDGLGRDDRLRYDAPTFAGFTPSVTFAADEAFDVALRWSRNPDGGDWRGAAAIGYADTGKGDGDAEDESTSDADSIVSGSASVRLAGGASLTVALGRGDAPERTPRFGYAKLGYRFDRFALGETRVSIDYHASDEVVRADERATSAGVQLVQHVSRFNASIFAVYRFYDLDAATGAFAEPDGGFAEGLGPTSAAARMNVAMVGLRVPF